MFIIVIGLISINAIIIISIIDYWIFKKWIKCENCGYTDSHWYFYLPANILEMFFFITGIFLGMGLR